jgi:hypothetical protein
VGALALHVVAPLGVVVLCVRPSTTPGLEPSSCGRARPFATPTSIAPHLAPCSRGGRRPHKGDRGGVGPTRGGSTGRGGLVCPSFYNPWTGTIFMWPGSATSASSAEC